MPHIRQNRSRWLMQYEYGATVNAPSKKGPSLRLEPFIYGNSGCRAGDEARSGPRGNGRLGERKLRQGQNRP